MEVGRRRGVPPTLLVTVGLGLGLFAFFGDPATGWLFGLPAIVFGVAGLLGALRRGVTGYRLGGGLLAVGLGIAGFWQGVQALLPG